MSPTAYDRRLPMSSIRRALRLGAPEMGHYGFRDPSRLKAEGITVKKSLFAAEQDHPEVARRRQQWQKYQGRLDPKLVFIDETWAKINMTRRQVVHLMHDPPPWPRAVGPAPGRQGAARALAHADLPGGLALRPDRGALQTLLPILAPGDIVVRENLGSHKRRALRRLIRAVGAKLCFLPPYLPDLNPIEQVFAKLKTPLRKADERTIEATWRRIGSLLDCFTPAECANYLKNSGYASA
jgi:transposase